MKVMLRSAILALTTAIAVGGTAAVAAAASPEFSPTPKSCGGCESKRYQFTLSGGSSRMNGGIGEWKYNGTSVGGGAFTGEGGFSETYFDLKEGSAYACWNEGLNLKTNNGLHGRVGLTSKEGSQAGLLLEGLATSCKQEGYPAEITGSLIGGLGPVNTPSSTFSLSYSGSGDLQSPQSFEGESAKHNMLISNNGGAPSELALTGGMTMSVTSEGEPVKLELNTAGGAATLNTGYGGGFHFYGGAMKFVSKNGLELKCKTSVGSGHFTNAKEGQLGFAFEGCTGLLGVKCNTSGRPAGVISTQPLVAKLVYTYPAKAPALLLSAESGSTFFEATCNKVTSVISGSLLEPISSSGSASKVFPLSVKQAKEIQEVRQFETESGEVNETFLQTSTSEGKKEESGMEASSAIYLNGGGEETIK